MKKFLVRFAFLLLCGHGASQAEVNKDEILAMGESSFNTVNRLIEHYENNKKELLVSLGQKITDLAEAIITEADDPRQNLSFLLAVIGTTMHGAEEYVERAAKTVSAKGLTQIVQQNSWDKVNKAPSWTGSFRAVLDIATTKMGSTLGLSRRNACSAIEMASFINRACYQKITDACSEGSHLEPRKIKNYCEYAADQNNYNGVDSLCEQAKTMFHLEHTLKMSLANRLEFAKKEKNASEMEEILIQMNTLGTIKSLTNKAGGLVQKTILKKQEDNSVTAANSAITQISSAASYDTGLASYRLIHLHFLAHFIDDSFNEEFKQIFDYIVSTFNHNDFSITQSHVMKMVNASAEQHETLRAAIIAFFKKHLCSSDNDHIE